MLGLGVMAPTPASETLRLVDVGSRSSPDLSACWGLKRPDAGFYGLPLMTEQSSGMLLGTDNQWAEESLRPRGPGFHGCVLIQPWQFRRLGRSCLDPVMLTNYLEGQKCCVRQEYCNPYCAALWHCLPVDWLLYGQQLGL